MDGSGDPALRTSEPRDARLDAALRTAVADAVGASDRLSVLYSGGLDSSIVAFLAKPLTSVRLVVVGTSDARDPAAARRGAELLELPIIEEIVDGSDVDRVLDRFRDEFAGLSEPLRSVDAALAIALSRVADRVALVGQGADELFYGYAHFRGLTDADARARATSDLELLSQQEWPRAQRFARSYDREIRSPFLDGSLVRAAREFSPPSADHTPKSELRRAAARLGLPGPLVDAPKRALQYGSGVHRLLRRRDAPQ
ncbi:MAG: asparagine synthase-related protein [Thermoplasmata archaeon]|nr:asparagine synthase-related protein [Thermoplasmata archaeon]